MSTFTATNGGSPKVTTSDANNASNHAGSTEGTNGSSAPRAPLAGDQPAGDQPPRNASPTNGDRETAEAMNTESQIHRSANFADSENSHKRKRSDESMDEARREGHMQPERHPVATGPERPYLTTERDPFERDQRDRDYHHYGDEHRERERDRESWYSPQESRDGRNPYSQPASAVPDSAHTDEQMGEVLRRATEQDYPQTSPEGEDGSIGYSQYTPERKGGGPQADAKKRKRIFSNRTKTGCMTCRRRKKKCDEAKPECSNCLKGGFVCEGYPPQRGGTWLKPENKVPAIQIESKDPNYKPPGAYGMPQQAPFPSQQPPLNQGKREPLPSYRGQPLRIEPPQGRPLYTEDDRPTASTLPSASVTSPDNKLSALTTPYSSANVFPTPVSAAPVPFPERSGPKEYQRVPPLHDLSRTEPDMTPQSTTLPHINIMHATRTNSPITTPQSSSVAQATAQLALSHTSQFSPSGPGRREKDEMLAGRSFFPFEKELVLERERCYGTLCRFNNSMNPNNGVSPTERARLFQEVLQPKVPVQLTPTQTSPITHAGRLGENVVVEAPFTCDYGYNIQIGNDTLIGRNCTILDACEVKIGNNVVIGPNVSFYTTTMTTDPRRRQGARGACQGKPIIIEDDVFIGGSVTIMGGVKIGKGTTVGAGSLVSRSLPAFCICTGQPAKVRRGVASTY